MTDKDELFALIQDQFQDMKQGMYEYPERGVVSLEGTALSYFLADDGLVPRGKRVTSYEEE